MKSKLYIPHIRDGMIYLPQQTDFIYGAKSARGRVYRYEGFETQSEPKYRSVWEHLHEVEMRERFWAVKRGEVVIDAGACFGSYTCSAAADGAFVHAFEPDPPLFDALERVVKLNGWKHVRLYNEKANIDLKKLKRLDRIKIDVEGDELETLKGAMETIKKFRPMLLIECHISKNPNIVDDVFKLVSPFKRITFVREAITEKDSVHVIIDFL